MPFSKTEIALLKASGILQDIPPDILHEALVSNPDGQLRLQAGAMIFQAGQPSQGLYLVVHGIIELFVADAGNKEKVLDFAQTGTTLAEETLFSERPLHYSARSLNDAAVLHLPNALIADWIARYPAFALRLMSLVAQRIDFLNKDMLTFRTKKATARLVCYLLCHFNSAPRTRDGSYSLDVPIPRSKLASRLGITSSHLSRAFRELQENGMIVAQGRGYFIPDVPALSKYVCPAGCDFGAASVIQIHRKD